VIYGDLPPLPLSKLILYVLFVDDHTRYAWLYPLLKKSNFLQPSYFFNA